jgi:hypothetical protein
MAISINWETQVITIPQADLTYLSPGLYELDVDVLRLALKDIEDGEEGIAFPDTHRHNTEVTLAGVTYARTFEIINGYTVTFQDTGSPYTVKCIGANHNIGDVKNVNQVSLIVGNSAGLITVASGSGLSVEQSDMLEALAKIHGLVIGAPLTVSTTSREAGGIEQTIEEAAGVVTVERVA